MSIDKADFELKKQALIDQFLLNDTEILPSKHYLDACGTSWLQLEGMQTSEPILPVYNYVKSVQVCGGVHVYQAVLRTWVVLHHRSILIVAIHRYREV